LPKVIPRSTRSESEPTSTRDATPASGFFSSAAIFFPLFFLLLWAARNWYQTVERVVHNYNPLPVQDYWRIPENLSRYRNFDLRVLWIPHNEHRIVFPEIVFAADVLMAHGREFLPLAASFLCYLGVFYILAAAVLEDKRIAPPVRLAAVLLSAGIMGWQGSAFVLADPFLLQWTLTQLGAFLSLALLTRVSATGRNSYLAGTIAAAVVATYSSGNGMLLWPILLAAGAILEISRRQLATLASTGAIATALYFVGYGAPSKLNLANFFLHPLYSLEFIGAYVGMPFGGMKAPSFGAYVGLISIALTAGLFTAAARRGLLRSSTAIALFGCYSFTLLTAILTAAGRMDPTDTHYSMAESRRYLTVPLANWAVFISAAIWVSARRKWKVFTPVTIAVMISTLLLLGLPKLRWWLRDNQGYVAEYQLATLSIQDGLTDPSLLGRIFPEPAFVEALLPALRAGHLSIYARDRSKWLGRPITAFAQVVNQTASGQITYSYPVASGLEIAGWTDESSENSGGWFALANEAKQIVGFGRRLPAGFPPSLPAYSAPPSSGWVGFANLAYPSKQIFVYAITPAGLLPMAGSVAVPALDAVNMYATGSPIPGITWRAESIRISSELPQLLVHNTPPGPIYSTWNGDDGNQGQIDSSDFAVPASGCFILPVLHGPSTDGLSVEIINAETAQTVAAAPMQDYVKWWSYWRFHAGSNVQKVRVSVQDHGSGWGQWIAIGQPYECR